MDTKALERVSETQLSAIVDVVCDAVRSDETKRAYKRALDNFLQWHGEQGRPRLIKAVVRSYITHLRDSGMGAAAINQRRAAINKLVREAVDNDVMSEQAANGILNIEGERQTGERIGNWLNKEQAQDLINAPDVATLKGLRDRAILALSIGAGLRRSEIASLLLGQVQQRDGRWVLVDIVGKRNKTRSVPIPSWGKVAINAWLEAANIDDGVLFRRVNKGDNLAGNSMSAQAVYDVIKQYSVEVLGYPITAHDLRRTYAHLALKGGSPIEQISLTLGHESIETTQRYLGVKLDLYDAPCDRLGLSLEWNGNGG